MSGASRRGRTQKAVFPRESPASSATDNSSEVRSAFCGECRHRPRLAASGHGEGARAERAAPRAVGLSLVSPLSLARNGKGPRRGWTDLRADSEEVGDGRGLGGALSGGHTLLHRSRAIL